MFSEETEANVRRCNRDRYRTRKRVRRPRSQSDAVPSSTARLLGGLQESRTLPALRAIAGHRLTGMRYVRVLAGGSCKCSLSAEARRAIVRKRSLRQ